MTNFAELSHLIVEEIARVWGQDGGDGETHFKFMSFVCGITAAARRKALLLHCEGMKVQEIFEAPTDPGATTTYTRLHFEHSMHTLHHK